MKFIASHDIDHWRWRDHLFRDLYLPKHVLRNTLDTLRGRLPFGLYAKRMKAMTREYQHGLEGLLEWNQARGIEATYFVAVTRGRSLAYGEDTAAEIVEWLRARGCQEIGLHAIAHDDADAIRRERSTMARILGHEDFGVRVHYLRDSGRTLDLFNKVGFPFSSNTETLSPPWSIGRLVEFPISVMDVSMVRREEDRANEAEMRTLERFHDWKASSGEFFVVNFHDSYFTEAYPRHREWYESLVNRLLLEGVASVSFREALAQFEEPHRCQ